MTDIELDHILRAQDPLYPAVLAELRAGRKQSHWMWFIFPQIAGLGASPTARRFAITDLGQARAYLAHPVLGKRLKECCGILLTLDTGDAEAIFGYPDVLKLRSSMTLFAAAGADRGLFGAVLDKYYDGEGDPATAARLYGADGAGR